MQMTKMLVEEYRPKSLQEIVGQTNVKKLVSSWLRTDRVPRSILIHGDLSSCKTSLSRILASALLCTDLQEGSVSCRKCKACLAVEADVHPDYAEINAASDRGIDAMRALAQKVVMKPLLNKRRVIVLDECHGLTPQSWEALLKVLEEPPAHVVWILITTAPEKLRPTVVSRCSHLKMGALSEAEVMDLLKQVVTDLNIGKVGITEKHLLTIVRCAQAHARNALHILDQVYTLVLDAQGAGSVDEAVINSFIDTVVAPTAAAQAATMVRQVLAGQPAKALKRILDLPGEEDALLGHAVGILREAVLYAVNPKLAKDYFLSVFGDLPVASVDGRELVLEVYQAFRDARLRSTTQFVPASDVIYDVVAQSAIKCQKMSAQLVAAAGNDSKAA
jgi:DNA polymerase III subunit gamma/tau